MGVLRVQLEVQNHRRQVPAVRGLLALQLRLRDQQDLKGKVRGVPGTTPIQHSLLFPARPGFRFKAHGSVSG